MSSVTAGPTFKASANQTIEAVLHSDVPRSPTDKLSTIMVSPRGRSRRSAGGRRGIHRLVDHLLPRVSIDQCLVSRGGVAELVRRGSGWLVGGRVTSVINVRVTSPTQVMPPSYRATLCAQAALLARA